MQGLGWALQIEGWEGEEGWSPSDDRKNSRHKTTPQETRLLHLEQFFH